MIFRFSRLDTLPVFFRAFSIGIILPFTFSIFDLIGMIARCIFPMMIYLLNFRCGIRPCVGGFGPFVRSIIITTTGNIAPFHTFVSFQITFVHLSPFSVVCIMTEVKSTRTYDSYHMSHMSHRNSPFVLSKIFPKFLQILRRSTWYFSM